MKGIIEQKNLKQLNYFDVSFTQQKEGTHLKVGNDERDLLKEGLLDQHSLLIICLVDLLQNLIDGAQLAMAHWNVGQLESMNQYISEKCLDYSDNTCNDELIDIVQKAAPILFATITLNIFTILHIFYVKRMISNYYISIKKDPNKLQSNVSEIQQVLSSFGRKKCLQIGIVQLKVLLRIELTLSQEKNFIQISDVIIIMLTILWISERQNRWLTKIVALDLNIIYLVTRLQLKLNLFSILKSLLLILVIIFQYSNRGLLDKQQEYLISTFNKWLENSNLLQQNSMVQNVAMNSHLNKFQKQLNNCESKRTDKIVIQEDSVIDIDKKLDAISFHTQKDFSKQQSNPSSKKNSPRLISTQKYPLFGKREENLAKINPTIVSMIEMMPSAIQNFRKQSLFRKLITSEHFIERAENNCKVSSLSNQILNQINQGVILMNLNQCIVFHNKQILDILAISSSSKIISKLSQLKKEIKIKEGDLLDKKPSTEEEHKSSNSKKKPKTTQCIQAPLNQNQFHEVNGKTNKTQQSNSNFSSSTSIHDISIQAGGRMRSKRGDQKKKTYLNNKSASSCDFLLLPPKVIFNNNQNKKNSQKNKQVQPDNEGEEEQQNEEKSIREVEEDQDSDNDQQSSIQGEKYDKSFLAKKSVKNIKKLRQSFSAKKRGTEDNKKEYKEKSIYSTDEKSFEVIIQEIISLIQLYRQNVGYRSCKSENNLDHSTLIQEQWLYNCEKTIQILQNEGYTFNAILENEYIQSSPTSTKNIQINKNIMSEEKISTTKIPNNPKKNLQASLSQLSSNNINDTKQQKQSNETEQKQRETKIISVQIKLWNSPSNEDEIDEIKENRDKANTFGNKNNSHNLMKPDLKKARKLSSMITDKSQVPMLFIIFQDITKQVEQEEQDKMNRFKLKILSSISHELRTPLNCSMVMLQMLIQSELISQTVKQDYLEPAFYNNQLLYFIINDILDYAQISQNSFQLKFSSFELCPALQDCLNLFSYSAEFKGIHLSLSVDQTIPQVINSDQERIKQVLINLVSNALKYTVVGSICVNAIPSQNEKDMIEISVEDTGCGIPVHLHNVIFEYMDNPTQRKQELNTSGAGLGLTISQKIVRGLSGNRGISLESEEGVGSKFTFYVKNREPSIQKSQHGKKNNQFNNIFLNWKSMSYNTLQSQEFKSDLSSMKGLTNKSQLTPRHVSSPQSRGSMNFPGSKDEIERKLYLNTYAMRNSFMRKGSKFLEENLISRDQNTLSSSIDHSYEIYHMNHISERRQSRKSNNQLYVNYNEKSSLQSQSQYQDYEIEGKKILQDLKSAQQLRSYDVLDSFTDIDNVSNNKNQVQALQPFQGHSSIAYQEQYQNKRIYNQSSNVSSTTNSQHTLPQPSSQNEIHVRKYSGGQINQDGISQINKNLRILAAQQYNPSPNTSITGLLNTVKEINDESMDLDSGIILSSEKHGNSSRKLIVKTKFNGQNSPLYSDDRHNSFNEIESAKINLHHNSSHIQETPRLLSAQQCNETHENIKISSLQNDQNNITFNSGFFIESERTPAINLSKVIQQESEPNDQMINEILSPEKKSNLSYSFNIQHESKTEIKINNQIEKKISETNHNEAEAGDVDKLIQQQSKEQLQTKQDQLKVKLKDYFSKQNCKCIQVLVVDDNQFNALVMKRLLSSYSINADQAFNGKNALDLVIQKQETSCCRHYKLILMDIDMPIMNGYESTQAILDLYKDKFKNVNPPIISACTAFVSNEDKIQAKKRGMKFFLGKPIELFHLDFIIEYSLLRKKR